MLGKVCAAKIWYALVSLHVPTLTDLNYRVKLTDILPSKTGCDISGIKAHADCRTADILITSIIIARGLIFSGGFRFNLLPFAVLCHKALVADVGEEESLVDGDVCGVLVGASAGIIGAEDNSTGWWTVFSDNFNVPAGETRSISFTNYTSQANNWKIGRAHV